MSSSSPPAPTDTTLAMNSSSELSFSNLRGVQWRINLGILPSSPSSVEDFRRVVADSRRRYASLRHRLLVDPHLPKDGNQSPDLVMDNPLSQNPDSTWGRFFRNAELEKVVDQDLSRLYPEPGSYFQTPPCQAMLRRILLLWCLRHPEHGYGQGMHELLAPLLYVLHVDAQCLYEVRKKYEDLFIDEFDLAAFPGSDVVTNYKFRKTAKRDDDDIHEENVSHGSMAKDTNLANLDPETRGIILLSDAYGAEGELGILLSDRFMEHDAYCMFDALMNGVYGVVAIADFFSPFPGDGSSTGLVPVIEASSAVYHLLSLVDSSLHNHLVELKVEPQYFALRWLRVLFGREFSLDDLLVVWDEIFSSPNGIFPRKADSYHSNFHILSSSRGAFISAMAVSMILHLRSSLLATENPTSCLQKLLNFPEKINVKKLIAKARSLHAIALQTNVCSSSSTEVVSIKIKTAVDRGQVLLSGPISPKTPLYSLPESYWEEKWRVFHKEGEHKRTRSSISKVIMNKLYRERLSLSRTESAPSPSEMVSGKTSSQSSVRQNLLDDMSREADTVGPFVESECDKVLDSGVNTNSTVAESKKDYHEGSCGQNINEKNLDRAVEETCLNGENSLFFTETDHENDLEKSSVNSNSFPGDNSKEATSADVSCCSSSDAVLHGNLASTSASTARVKPSSGLIVKQATISKERKLLPGKFQWFWKFGRGTGEGNLEKVGSTEQQKHAILGNAQKDISRPSIPDGSCSSEKAETFDKEVTSTLTNLGQLMLENIQAIESVLQKDQGQVALLSDSLRDKGQVAAMEALEKLRKISNHISEM